jgi:8-oxo-dGTP diphosphatase
MTTVSHSQGSHPPVRKRASHRDIAVLVVIFTVEAGRLQVLLVKRSAEPFRGSWTLPGGLLAPDESLDQAAVRKLEDETGVTDVFLEQLYSFSNLDERHTIASVYFALVDSHRAHLAQRRAWLPAWHPIDGLPDMPFDNGRVIDYALQRFRAKLDYSNVAYSVLPPEFTLSQLQRTYEAILARTLDKRNFRKRMLSLDIIAPTGRTATEGRHRPAQLYAFREHKPVVF